MATLAALYGAGGSEIGPRVAERLGVPFLDREIPDDEAPRSGSQRLFGGVALGRGDMVVLRDVPHALHV